MEFSPRYIKVGKKKKSVCVFVYHVPGSFMREYDPKAFIFMYFLTSESLNRNVFTS